MQATGNLSAADKIYEPQTAGHGLLLPPPPGEVAADRRGVVRQGVGCGVWEVGGSYQERAMQRTAVFPQATGYKPRAGSKTPTPTLPEGEGALPDTKRKLRASCQLQNYRPQATGHMPPFPIPPDEAGHAGRDPGSMP